MGICAAAAARSSRYANTSWKNWAPAEFVQNINICAKDIASKFAAAATPSIRGRPLTIAAFASERMHVDSSALCCSRLVPLSTHFGTTIGRFVGLCALLLHPCGAFAGDAVLQTPQTRAELSAERRVVAPGESLWVALSIDLKPKWHTYWRTPGDAGEPIVIRWNLPAGVVAGPIQWPTPERFTFSDIAGFGYTGHVTLLTELKIAESIAVTEILI